jgi:hypothetical protein
VAEIPFRQPSGLGQLRLLQHLRDGMGGTRSTLACRSVVSALGCISSSDRSLSTPRDCLYASVLLAGCSPFQVDRVGWRPEALVVAGIFLVVASTQAS